jgi:hypothetical protein
MSPALRSDVKRHLLRKARRMALPLERLNQPHATSCSKCDFEDAVEGSVFSYMGLQPILRPSCLPRGGTSAFAPDSLSATSLKKLSA